MTGWQTVTREDDEHTEKLVIPEGMLYRTIIFNSTDNTNCVAMVFVPGK